MYLNQLYILVHGWRKIYCHCLRTNECVFECVVCRPARRFNSKNKISFHIKRAHGLRMTEYNCQHGSSLVSRAWHTCQVQSTSRYHHRLISLFNRFAVSPSSVTTSPSTSISLRLYGGPTTQPVQPTTLGDRGNHD